MPQVLASGKTGSQRYEDLNATKPCPDLDDITLIQNFQNSYEETQGYSLCNNKGNSDSIDTDLDDITLANVSTYNKNLSQLIQTYVANGSYLDVDAASTANNIILLPRKIADIASPNGNNYAKATSLPFTYRDNLRFAFRATANNSSATQFTITGLAGLVGAKDLIDETGSDLVGGEIISGRFYEIVLTGTGGTQKGVLVNAVRSSGNSVQVVNTQTGAVATGTTVMPYDDTIPQNTEGDQYMTLTITPTNALNKLKIEVVGLFEANTAVRSVVALFQDSIANALAAANSNNVASQGIGAPICFTHYMTAGTTSATTFKVRAGCESAGTITFNGAGTARRFGGVSASSITITEIQV